MSMYNKLTSKDKIELGKCILDLIFSITVSFIIVPHILMWTIQFIFGVPENINFYHLLAAWIITQAILLKVMQWRNA